MLLLLFRRGQRLLKSFKGVAGDGAGEPAVGIVGPSLLAVIKAVPQLPQKRW
jgi:hypothetical protein